MELPHFDITKCLPFDIMHTVFEGVIILSNIEISFNSV